MHVCCRSKVCLPKLTSESASPKARWGVGNLSPTVDAAAPRDADVVKGGVQDFSET